MYLLKLICKQGQDISVSVNDLSERSRFNSQPFGFFVGGDNKLKKSEMNNKARNL